MKSQFAVLLVILFIAACVPASPVFHSPTGTAYFPTRQSVPSTPTATKPSTQTATSTQTSTPQTPLTSHEWVLHPVLIRLDSTRGDGGGYDQIANPPSLLVLADGRVFISDYESLDNYSGMRIRTATLNRRKICALLNTVDQAGFFDFDTSTYERPADSAGAPHNLIEINAWRKNSGLFYGLYYFLKYDATGFNRGPTPVIPPSLRNTAHLLYGFQPEGLTDYIPERIAVWVTEHIEWRVESSLDIRPWPLTTQKVAGLHSQTGSAVDQDPERYIVLRDKIAGEVYDIVRDSKSSGIYEEDGRQFSIFVQVLLPFQLPRFEKYGSVFGSQLRPKETMFCSPEDGRVKIKLPEW